MMVLDILHIPRVYNDTNRDLKKNYPKIKKVYPATNNNKKNSIWSING